jgi:hypothetical protein
MLNMPASPAAHRRETLVRLRRVEDSLDKLVEMGRGVAEKPSSPSSTDSEVEEVGKLLVEGRIRLPTHARLTVTTTVETVHSKVFGTSEVFTHTADQLHTRLLRPVTVRDALEAGLIRRVERGWVWSEAAYARLVKG